jgi:hypothetical protein
VILSSKSTGEKACPGKGRELVDRDAAPGRFVFGSVSYRSKGRRLFVPQKRFMSAIIQPRPDRFHVSLPT